MPKKSNNTIPILIDIEHKINNDDTRKMPLDNAFISTDKKTLLSSCCHY